MMTMTTTKRGFSKAAITKLNRLAGLIADHDNRCWEIGDLVSELVHSHRMPLAVISRKLNYSKPRLSEFSVTARFFAADERTTNFQDSLMARRMFVRFPALKMTSIEIRNHIAQMHGKRPGEIKSYFAQLHANAEARRALSESVHPHMDRIQRQCHHADWQHVLPSLPDQSIKIINADPPFGGYSWRDDGGYISSRAGSSGLRAESDSNTDAEAMSATLALFQLAAPKLKPGGCLLLWQPGARADNLKILEQASSCGWELPVVLTWLKSNTGVAAEDCPYAPATERILVFVRKGSKLIKHERDLSRSDVLSFPSETIQASQGVRRGTVPPRSTHMFQKPLGLMEHLIRKHSYPGELLVDCFGCSGSACIAAERLGRPWVYIERNEENFNWGRQRLAEACEDLSNRKPKVDQLEKYFA